MKTGIRSALRRIRPSLVPLALSILLLSPPAAAKSSASREAKSLGEKISGPAQALPPRAAAPQEGLSIEELTRTALKSEDEGAWRKAMEELARKGRPGAAALAAAIDSESAARRLKALELLGEMGPAAAAAVPKIVSLTEGHEESGYLSLNEARSGESARAALEALMGLVRPRPGGKTKITIINKGKRPTPKEPGAGAFALRKAAMAALQGIGPPALDGLIRAVARSGGPAARLRSAYSDLRLCFGLTAAAAGSEAFPAVEEALKDKRPSVQAAGLVAAALLGKRAPGLAPLVLPFLEERDFGLRARAAEALGMIRAKDEVYRAALEKVLSDEKALVRLRAAFALFGLTKDADRCVPVIAGCIKERDERVRAAAVAALRRIDPVPEKAGPAVFARLRDPSSRVRLEALRTIMVIAPATRGLADRLMQLAKDKDHTVSREARRNLKVLERRGK